MAGYDRPKPTRTKATDSRFIPFSQGISFRQSQTEPSQGHASGAVWNDLGDGQQYLHQDSQPQGISQDGFSDSLNPFASPMSQPGRHDASRTAWPTNLSISTGEEMSRMASIGSAGAQSALPFDQSRSAVFPNRSQVAFISGESGIEGRSSPHQQLFEQFPYPGEDSHDGLSMYSQGAISAVSPTANFSARPSYDLYAASAPDGFASVTAGHMPEPDQSIMFGPSVISESPTWTSAPFPDSQRSSPVLDEWNLQTQVVDSKSTVGLSPGHTLDSPDVLDLPPYAAGGRVLKRAIGPRFSKVASDLASRPNDSSEPSEDSMRSVDNTARDHPLYHNAATQADGLYHCPWEGKEGCTHKPEKLKCNYDKFVDSHLKPYRCKVIACENSRFSSTACLLRHEREAHAMHGHGDKPFLCSYESCDRSVAGNGFPRHWNLCDHMRRVHNDPGPAKSNGSKSPPPASSSTRGKKRKSEAAETTDSKPSKKAATHKEPGLVDHYHQSREKLMELVKQLQDPRNTENMEILRSANNCIKVMVQTTQRIQSAPAIQTSG